MEPNGPGRVRLNLSALLIGTGLAAVIGTPDPKTTATAALVGVEGLKALMGIAGNIFASDFVEGLQERQRDAKYSHANSDLTRLIGRAIAHVLHRLPKDQLVESGARRWAEALAKVAAERWVEIADHPRFGAAASDRLVEIFAASAGTTTADVHPLSFEDCRMIVLHASARTGGKYVPTEAEIELAATRLHDELFGAIREMFKRDFGAGGRAYAALCVDTSAAILQLLQRVAASGDAHRDELRALRLIVEERVEAHRQALTSEQVKALGETHEYSRTTVIELGVLQQKVDRLSQQLAERQRADSVEPELLASYWLEVRLLYKGATVDRWLRAFPRSHFGTGDGRLRERLALVSAVPWLALTLSAAPDGKRPPFIATQSFELLDSEDGQMDSLKPEAFLSGRDSEQEARARAGSRWHRFERRELIAAVRACGQPQLLGATGVMAPEVLRLCLVTGSGVGKTTNMQWLEAALDGHAQLRSGRDLLAVLIEAEALVDAVGFDAILGKLTDAIVARTAPALKERWAREAIEHGLRSDLRAGRLAVLVDGLDHVAPAQATRIVRELMQEGWTACPIVFAGRPHALAGFRAPGSLEGVDAGCFRFIAPSEFEPEEARVYLDTPGGPSRYEQVEASLGGLVHVPRVLHYVRTLTQEQLRDCRTSADVYLLAVTNLISETIVHGGAPTAGMDANRAIALLAALAFHTVCPTESDGPRIPPAPRTELDPGLRGHLYDRMKKLGYGAHFERDMIGLAAFVTIVANGIVSAVDYSGGTPSSLVWSNRTVREFLAAYWLARCAQPNDSRRMRYHVFRPEDHETNAYYELNVFLAEMPARGRTPASWVAAARTFYEPSPAQSWPTEMLYRAWPTMHAIARRSFDDWWNVSYERIFRNDRRCEPQPNAGNDQAAAIAANEVLERYQSGFQTILDAGDARAAIASELIADDAYRAVEAVGAFAMGSSPERQGFPKQTEAYWTRVLDEVQCGRRAEVDGPWSAKDAAVACTPDHWFAGASGERLKQRDIGWLTDILKPLEPRPGAEPDPDVRARAFAAIRDKWRRRDETPAEPSQAVAAFALHRYPVLHRWYRLFAPNHAELVANQLADVGLIVKGERVDLRPPPAEDHPAIYVSWYDAWAFCQWVRWRDPGQPKRRYGLRLPHEVEWEYAARWAIDAAGKPTLTPRDQPYFWGSDFYRSDDGSNQPVADPRHAPYAHAYGTPGATRAPAQSLPNGLGLHDMLGNVWEWMANIYDASETKTVESRSEVQYSRYFPRGGAPANPQRAMRGGLWYYLDLLATVSNRYRLTADDRDYKIGFRIVREQV